MPRTLGINSSINNISDKNSVARSYEKQNSKEDFVRVGSENSMESIDSNSTNYESYNIPSAAVLMMELLQDQDKFSTSIANMVSTVGVQATVAQLKTLSSGIQAEMDNIQNQFNAAVSGANDSSDATESQASGQLAGGFFGGLLGVSNSTFSQGAQSVNGLADGSGGMASGRYTASAGIQSAEAQKYGADISCIESVLQNALNIVNTLISKLQSSGDSLEGASANTMSTITAAQTGSAIG